MNFKIGDLIYVTRAMRIYYNKTGVREAQNGDLFVVVVVQNDDYTSLYDIQKGLFAPSFSRVNMKDFALVTF